jgi:glutamate 5-kinase
MASKLMAVQTAVEAGIPTWIAGGRTPGVVAGVPGGKIVGTYFHAVVSTPGRHVALEQDRSGDESPGAPRPESVRA